MVRDKCDCCEEWKFTVEERRRNTQYMDDEMNKMISCVECWASDYEGYAEIWADYYSGCL